jgi:hypothetical protein
MELFNETCVILINYHLICFTDFVLDLEKRDQVGYSLIAVTLFNIAVNLSLISYQNMVRLCRKIKLYRLKLTGQKAIEVAHQRKKESLKSRTEQNKNTQLKDTFQFERHNFI